MCFSFDWMNRRIAKHPMAYNYQGQNVHKQNFLMGTKVLLADKSWNFKK